MSHQHVEEVKKKNIINSGGDDDDEFLKKLHGHGDGDDDEDEMVFGSTYMSLLGSKDRDFLLSHGEAQVKISELEGKVVGIYFSANWYTQCRHFDQVLISTYNHLKTNTTNTATTTTAEPGFEIVLVSSDEDSEAFDDYRSTMPWLAIPFSDLDTKKALNRAFSVEDIPCLIILQPGYRRSGAVIHDGVGVVYRYGVEAFPFTKERVEELQERERAKRESQTLPDLLTSRDRDFLLSHPLPKQVPVTSLVGKTIGLYFSAQWCLPGVKFTAKLISIYRSIKQELLTSKGTEEDFEIVFVSSDRDKAVFESHFQTMPWLALPFDDPAIRGLIRHFDIQRIPNLVILGPDGRTVTPNGRSLINLYQEEAYPFTGERVESLEKRISAEAKKLPRFEYHVGHEHGLSLVSEGNGGGPFICCGCDEQGSGWVYQCAECGYQLHPKCIRAADPGSRGSTKGCVEHASGGGSPGTFA